MIRLCILIYILVFSASCGNKNILIEVKKNPSYPSASGIQYLNDHFYMIGDDAKKLLILDTSLNASDSITIYPFSEERIPKSTKSDLESITITKNNQLILFGSGSESPYRNIAWLIDPKSRQKQFIHLDTFYQRIKLNGIEALNIEGSCSFENKILLSNRGSKGYPKNTLIFTDNNFWHNQSVANISTITIGINEDSATFKGISGLTYSQKSDRLIMTVSTEKTYNSFDDGAIGKSYIWIINNFSSKIKWKAINPDKIIDLENIDKRFIGQKIESACILKETRKLLHLVLVADNDDGSSTLFRLVIEKNR